MTNPNDDFHPLFNNNASPEYGYLSSFGLDYDDDEFRAGYPFSDVPEVTLDGSLLSISVINQSSFLSRKLGILRSIIFI